MTNEYSQVIGEMRVSVFLPAEHTPKGVIIPQQVHGTNIVSLDSGNEDVTKCDALITKNRNITVGIRTADCAAVCFCDGDKIGIAHVGWRGLCAGLTERMLGNFDAKKLSVYVAPFLNMFEIKKDGCHEQISQKFGDRFFEERGARIFFNFNDALASLLPLNAVFDARNTETDYSFPSNRRDGTSERFVTTVNFR